MVTTFVWLVKLEFVGCREEKWYSVVHSEYFHRGWECCICGSHGNQHELQKKSGWRLAPRPTGCCGGAVSAGTQVRRNLFLWGLV